MAKVQFHGNITGREDAKAVFNVMFNEFLAKGNTDNMHVIIEAWEQDGEVQADAEDRVLNGTFSRLQASERLDKEFRAGKGE